MNLEQQVCSLELAKRLKELGVKQDSFFFWKRDGSDSYLVASNSRYMVPREQSKHPLSLMPNSERCYQRGS
jgi:hypothetical protein